MSFLSSQQRQRAIGQQQAYIALLNADLDALAQRVVEVRELRKCAEHNVGRLIAADEGDCPIEDVQQADDYARDLMTRGITHYPVIVASGQKATVKA